MLRVFERRVLIFLLISICLILFGCGNAKEVSEETDIQKEPVAVVTPIVDIPEESDTDEISGDSVVDLTVMSSTVVYGQVYNMMYYPEKFIGKTVKMKGLYSDYYDQASGKHYYACIIMDATACCAQGVEFILTEDYKYPDDYPEDGDEITVEGTFDVYEEDGGSYCTLRNASLLSG